MLARFALGPAEWGVYGIAQTVLLVLLSANELGVGLAIVRWEGDARRFAPTVLTLSTLSSGLLYVALFRRPRRWPACWLAGRRGRPAGDVPVRGDRRGGTGARRLPHP
ncbi:oligosaccharide flippase family protein [Streptomyces diastatochromogenes]|nr:oligosaccharide flippase family protein [Streptomyces diastatochromogenes]